MKVDQKGNYKDDPHHNEDMRQIFKTLQKVSFADNMDGSNITFVSSATADAENIISHPLKRTPTGFIKVNQNKPCSVYKGTTTWTKDKIYLKVNIASAEVTIFLF
uniref:Uncharacterized protein n=1 Tax=viral metagenome TaxID=1070528 RepID=A0A6H1Z620_9ZZZZ